MEETGPGTAINVAPRCGTPMTGRVALGFGLLFTLISLPLALMALRILPLRMARGVPAWIGEAMAFCFVLVGVSLILAGIRAMFRGARRTRLRTEHPDRPWLGDHAWDPEGVGDDNMARMLRALPGLVFVVLFLAPFNWLAFLSEHGGVFFHLVVGLFDLFLVIGVCTLIVWALRVLRFGRGRVAFGAFPLRLGTPVELTFRLPADLRTFESIVLRLRCAREVFEESGAGENRSVKTVVRELHADEQTVAGTDVFMGTEIVVRFDLPADVPILTDLSARPPTYWELDVHARQSAGLDYRGRYPLPVYLPAESTPVVSTLPEPAAVR